MKDSRSENMRLKYLYRSLIQKGKVKLPHHGARKLIGPDCAYHLYSGFSGKKAEEEIQTERQKDE